MLYQLVPDFVAEDVSGLSSCRHLKSIILKFRWTAIGWAWLKWDWPWFWATIAKHVSQLCPSIREIHFHLHLKFDDATIRDKHRRNIFGKGFIALEHALEREAFAKLQLVVFELDLHCRYKGDEPPKVPVPITREQVEEAIKTRLPKLHKRGIAQVRYKYGTTRIWPLVVPYDDPVPEHNIKLTGTPVYTQSQEDTPTLASAAAKFDSEA